MNYNSHDLLHISWALLHSCDLACPYCPEPQSEENSVLVRDNLLTIAYQALRIPAAYYHITLTGGEPLLHPFISELFDYLYCSPREVYISLETHGGHSLELYEKIVKSAPNGKLRLVITAHPVYEKYQQILELIAFVRSQNQHCAVKLAYDPDALEQTTRFEHILARFRAYCAYSFDIQLLRQRQNQGLPDSRYSEADRAGIDNALKRFRAAADSSSFTLPDWPPSIMGANNRGKPGRWCCLGINYIRIDTDGSASGSPCHMAPKGAPLWSGEPGAVRNLTPQAVLCPSPQSCPRQGEMPVFERKEQALEHIAQIMRNRAKSPTTPLLDPRGEINPSDKLMLKLAGLDMGRPVSQVAKITPAPRVCLERDKEMAAIVDILADNESREIFSRALKSLLTGDFRYLPGPRQNRKAPKMGKGKKEYFPPQINPNVLNIASPLTPEYLTKSAKLMPRKKSAIAGNVALDKLIDVLAWFTSNAADYQIYLESGDEAAAEIILKAKPMNPPKKRKPYWKLGIAQISIIIFTGANNPDHLRRCIYSILLQNLQAIEIIVCGNDDNQALISEFSQFEAIKLRFITTDKTQNLGNIALETAMGRYIIFLQATDVLDPGFLGSAIETITKENADIAYAKNGTLSGSIRRFSGKRDAFNQLLNGQIGRSKLYSAEFLWRNDISFATTQSLWPLEAEAFYYSNKTILLEKDGIIDRVETGQMQVGENIAKFADAINSIGLIYKNNNLQYDSSYETFVANEYHRNRMQIFAEINNCDMDLLPQLLNETTLLQIGSSKTLIQMILTDYALSFFSDKSSMQLLPIDSNFLVNNSAQNEQIACIPYANADICPDNAPILSVIMPNYNNIRYIGETLKSILTQSMGDFELIIVDDASSDGSWEELQIYALADRRIRLYRMGANRRQGVCRNIGMDKARGEYIIFVDSDDVCMPEFFSRAVALMEESGADIAAFSCQIEGAEGDVIKRRSEELMLNRNEAVLAFLENRIFPECWAKIYRKKLLNNTQIRFPADVYHQDIPFVFAALHNSTKVAASSFIAYLAKLSFDSSMRPSRANYLHIHSAYVFYAFVNQMLRTIKEDSCFRDLANGIDNRFIIWNLENKLLLQIASFQATGERAPMSEMDYELLRENQEFLKSLLIGASRSWSSVELAQTAVAHSKSSVCPPLLSVIANVSGNEEKLSVFMTSILNQSMPAFELILINSASHDAAWRICSAYAKNDQRIKLVDNNISCGPTRSEALCLARGKYVLFADCDTQFTPDFFLIGAALMESLPDLGMIQFRIDGAAAREKPNPVLRFETGASTLAWLDDSKLEALNLRAKIWRLSSINSGAYLTCLQEDIPFLLHAYANISRIAVCAQIGAVNCYVDLNDRKNGDGAFNDCQIRRLAFFAALMKYCARKNDSETRPASLMKAYVWRELRDRILPYLASCDARGLSVLEDDDLNSLRSEPELLRLIFRELAKSQSFAFNDNESPESGALLEFESCLPGTSSRPLITFVMVNNCDYADNTLDSLDALSGDFEVFAIENDKNHFAYIPKSHPENFHFLFMSGNMSRIAIKRAALEKASGKYVMFIENGELFEQTFIASIRRLDNRNDDVGMLVPAKRMSAPDYIDKSPDTVSLLRSYFLREDSTFVFSRDYLMRRYLEKPDMQANELIVDSVLNCSSYSQLSAAMKITREQETQSATQANAISAIKDFNALLHRFSDDNEMLEIWLNWIFQPRRHFLSDIMYLASCDDGMLLDDNLLSLLMSDDKGLRRLMSELAIFSGNPR